MPRLSSANAETACIPLFPCHIKVFNICFQHPEASSPTRTPSQRRVQEALSVARVQGDGWVWKKGLQAMAYKGGRSFQEGYDQPTDDVG